MWATAQIKLIAVWMRKYYQFLNLKSSGKHLPCKCPRVLLLNLFQKTLSKHTASDIALLSVVNEESKSEIAILFFSATGSRWNLSYCKCQDRLFFCLDAHINVFGVNIKEHYIQFLYKNLFSFITNQQVIYLKKRKLIFLKSNFGKSVLVISRFFSFSSVWNCIKGSIIVLLDM